jgi:hypothetical protein
MTRAATEGDQPARVLPPQAVAAAGVHGLPKCAPTAPNLARLGAQPSRWRITLFGGLRHAPTVWFPPGFSPHPYPAREQPTPAAPPSAGLGRRRLEDATWGASTLRGRWATASVPRRSGVWAGQKGGNMCEYERRWAPPAYNGLQGSPGEGRRRKPAHPPCQFGRGADNGRAISFESPARSALGGQDVASLRLPVSHCRCRSPGTSETSGGPQRLLCQLNERRRRAQDHKRPPAMDRGRATHI